MNERSIAIKWGVGLWPWPGRRGVFLCGYGGSLVIIEVDRRMTFAYVMNNMAPGGGTIAAALAERVKDIVNR
jgi:hypothetical protein